MTHMFGDAASDPDIVTSDACESGAETFAFERVIAEIHQFPWATLSETQTVDLAWAYYFFSVQFRENVVTARALYPDDEKLAELERGECATDNLSPWPGVAEDGERMNHDEFMARLLRLAPIPSEKRRRFEDLGRRYLDQTRGYDAITRALSLTSYEDGGLEAVFRGMLTAPLSRNAAERAFQHFLVQHVHFDSDQDGGHGALIRHLRPDDRVLPMWIAFRDLLTAFVPALAAANHDRTV
jgi:hypothetical protein